MDAVDQVRRAQAGDPAAREALARTWLRRAYGTALAITSRRQDAEDAAQEGMVKAFAQLGELREPERFGPWLQRIVRNAALDSVRRRRVRQVESRPIDGLADAETDPAHLLDGTAAWEALRTDERLVLWMVLVGGHTFADVASWLGASRSTVHRQWTRALERLRKEQMHVDL